jgi:hypothetical protein
MSDKAKKVVKFVVAGIVIVGAVVLYIVKR